MAREIAERLRGGILVLLLIGLTGVTVELLLLDHFEDVTQIIPFIAIGFAFATLGWHRASAGATTVRAIQIAMVGLIAVGLTGLVLHFRGNMEFQLDIDPTLSAWSLFSKVMRAQAPPALAPGVMAQLGLLGLLYAWRHPAARTSEEPLRGDRR